MQNPTMCLTKKLCGVEISFKFRRRCRCAGDVSTPAPTAVARSSLPWHRSPSVRPRGACCGGRLGGNVQFINQMGVDIHAMSVGPPFIFSSSRHQDRFLYQMQRGTDSSQAMEILIREDPTRRGDKSDRCFLPRLGCVFGLTPSCMSRGTTPTPLAAAHCPGRESLM